MTDVQDGREHEKTDVSNSLLPFDFRCVMCSRDKFTPHRISFKNLHIASIAKNLPLTKSGVRNMVNPELNNLFNQYELSLTDDENELLFKIASSCKLSLAEMTHACFLAGLSQLLYKIRSEEMRGSCCG